MIREKDILVGKDNQVTFRYCNGKTGKMETRTVSGVEFLRLILQHSLLKGFRRERNYGFLHPNSKSTITLLQLRFKMVLKPVETRQCPAILCACCGGVKWIVTTRIKTQKWHKPSETHG